MSILIQKEQATFYETFIPKEDETLEIMSFLEQIRSFQIPSDSSDSSVVVQTIPLHSLRFENNS